MTNRWNVRRPFADTIEIQRGRSESPLSEKNAVGGISENVSRILESWANVGSALWKVLSSWTGKVKEVERLFPLLNEEEGLFLSAISWLLRKIKSPPHGDFKWLRDRCHLLDVFCAYAKIHPSPKSIKDSTNGGYLVEEAIRFSLDNPARMKELFTLFGLSKEDFDIENVFFGLKYVSRYDPDYRDFNDAVRYFWLENDPRIHEIALGYWRLATKDMEESHQRILKAMRDFDMPKAAAIITLHTYTVNGFLTPNIEETFTPKQKHEHDWEYMRDFFRILIHKLDLTDAEEDEITKWILKSAMYSHRSLAFGSLYVDLTFWRKGRETEYEKWIADAYEENPNESVNEKFHTFVKSTLWIDVSEIVKDRREDATSKYYAEWAVFSEMDKGTTEFCESLPPEELEKFLMEGIGTVLESKSRVPAFSKRRSFDKVRAFASAFKWLKDISKNPAFANLMTHCHLRYVSNSWYVPIGELLQELAGDFTDEKVRDGWLAFFKKTLSTPEEVFENEECFKFCADVPEGWAILDLKEAYRKDEWLRNLVDNAIKYYGVTWGGWMPKLYWKFGKAGIIAEWFGVDLEKSELRHYIEITDE